LRSRLPAGWLYLVCLLPDLIDKPLFYVPVLLHRQLPLISGTRTFGHTGLFLVAWLLLAIALRRLWTWALFAGLVTHFALDVAGELVTGADPESSIWLAIFFPAFGRRFPEAHFHTLFEHLRMSAQSAYVIAGEIFGGALL